MAIKQLVMCDGLDCNNQANFSFIGNVHTVDSKDPEGVGGGLIGNNLTFGTVVEDLTEDGGLVGTTVAKVSHYCKSCTKRILDL